MIIDAHVHPVLFGPICKDPERVQFRKQQFGLYKSSPIPMEQVMAVMDHAGVDLAILFAEDYSAVMGQSIVSNEEIRLLMDAQPGRPPQKFSEVIFLKNILGQKSPEVGNKLWKGSG
jgi:hypothetical protein